MAVLAVVTAFGLAACSSKFKTYNGPEVTEIFVFKGTRKMYLMHHDRALATYDIDLGFAPDGHKEQKGDGRTPEGTYYIDRRNPDSAYHLSVGINYPNTEDRERAKEAGVSPGGDIFIHGGPTKSSDRNKKDWTAGCIAVTNKEIEDIYAMVRNGTPIHIIPSSTPIPVMEGGESTVLVAGMAPEVEGTLAPVPATGESAIVTDELPSIDDVLAAEAGSATGTVVIGEDVDLIGEGEPVE
ncbi:L,D-transpeptidase family protein [Maritimibacter sp. DP4N28-5]|uniref:L,D-transpeptidase family protein n=1 Tax=Maritimibacter dapengensis TaxID=2836868 RepID=A0ABS6T476_9RHOB|nr:L,D-transpeptidase family protein [Maritimibacter dapengensis]